MQLSANQFGGTARLRRIGRPMLVRALALCIVLTSPLLAIESDAYAEKFTSIVGVNLRDLPAFDYLATRFGFSPRRNPS